MARSPYEPEVLMREVDDAVRQDELHSFWRNYGRIVAIAVVLALAAFGGYLLWQNHRANVAKASSEDFAKLMKAAEGGNLDQATYDKIVAGGSPGYKTEAALIKAALASGKADAKDSIAAYDSIINDAAALQPMKDAALIRKTSLTFDSMRPEDAVAALKGLAIAGNAWFGSAGELTGIAYLRMGKRDLAQEMFASLTRDPLVPESIKLRAGQMASMLSSLPAGALPAGTAPVASTPALPAPAAPMAPPAPAK